MVQQTALTSAPSPWVHSFMRKTRCNIQAVGFIDASAAGPVSRLVGACAITRLRFNSRRKECAARLEEDKRIRGLLRQAAAEKEAAERTHYLNVRHSNAWLSSRQVPGRPSSGQCAPQPVATLCFPSRYTLAIHTRDSAGLSRRRKSL